MNRQDALRKLQACLRMASSSNAHEQAAALRQARKLMETYGLTKEDAAGAEYVGVEAPTRQRKSAAMPEYLSRLAHVVGDNFACAIVLVQRGGSVSVEFVGKPIAAKLSSYAFTVLRRQLESDAARHVARVRRADTRRRRRELFAEGWVIAVQVLLDPQPLSEDAADAARAFIRLRYGDVARVSPRRAERASGRRGAEAALADRAAGYSAGQQARLNRAVEKGEACGSVTQLRLGYQS
ncbi:DUF2786 domain-containing protein [Stenotrophomonas maltophilia]|uniref:DUF2786 domain-containing protein n=1 Tax=Stenotrophomonas maltophilia TaxID=40324 RepID=UPI0013DBBFF9|nr:DUF2786 domain-containing protein [Stenotrophomonas maltophilia]